jgi:small subunit ribosomal protein S5
MAEKETKNKPKDLIEAVPEELNKIILPTEEAPTRHRSEREMSEDKMREQAIDSWVPKTEIGRKVKAGHVSDFDSLLVTGKKYIEPQIADKLLRLKYDLLAIGQAKGKFGGGKRRAWRQTQKKTMEGNVVTFSSMAVVGDEKGHVGVGLGRAKETLPAREKAIRNAKLGVIKVVRGFETRESSTNDPHTIPFAVEGKCGSVRIKLLPAPRGTGLVIGDEGKKILKMAGIRDVYAIAKGQTRTTFNLAKAIIDALNKTNKMKQ